MRIMYMLNKGVVWRKILIEQVVIASHHRTDEETAAIASKWSCGYRHKLDFAV